MRWTQSNMKVVSRRLRMMNKEVRLPQQPKHFRVPRIYESTVLCVRDLGSSMRCQQCYDCANDNESSSVSVDYTYTYRGA
jgi:hypothetical protein